MAYTWYPPPFMALPVDAGPAAPSGAQENAICSVSGVGSHAFHVPLYDLPPIDTTRALPVALVIFPPCILPEGSSTVMSPLLAMSMVHSPGT